MILDFRFAICDCNCHGAEMANRKSKIANLKSPGITLLEMLAVLFILSMLMALSVAAYWRMGQSFKEQGAAAQLDVALRQARNAAISANAPAWVELDTEARRIVPWVYRTVGFWHFEDRSDFGKTTGAYHGAIMHGGQLFPEGKVGKCARLQEGAYIELGADPDFDCEDGGYLEAYVRPASYTFAGDNFIFFKKNAYSLKVGNGGVLVGNAGSKTLQAPGYHIVPGRWTKVAFAWDRQTTRLLVDDCLIAVGPGSRPPLTDYPLLIGHETASLDGLVDEARVMTAAAGNTLQLPRTFTIKHTAAPWSAVYFAADGSLDMRYHAGPLSVTLLFGQRARTVSISMLGQTTRQEVENVEAAAAPGAAPATAAAKGKLTLYPAGGSGAATQDKPAAPKAKKERQPEPGKEPGKQEEKKNAEKTPPKTTGASAGTGDTP